MRRILALSTAALALTLLLTGCGKPKVSVTTGERVYCTYGELLSSDVRTVKVPADEAKHYSIDRKTVTCEKHRNLGDLYDIAQDALKRGDLKTAKQKLAAVVAQDRTFRRAAEQLEDLRRGRRPAVDTQPPGAAPANNAPGSTDKPGGNEKPGESDKPEPKPEGPSASMSDYVPDEIAGFTAQPILAEDFSLTRQYTADDRSEVVALAIVAQQYRNKDAASTVVARHKRIYSQRATTATVAGKRAYIGTDGGYLAGLVYQDGSIVVVCELAAADNAADVLGELRRVGEEVLR